MPDPQRDIAPIIEPTAPPALPEVGDDTLAITVSLVALLVIAALVWRWRQQAPLRKIRRLAHDADPIDAANKLAALLKRYRLALAPDWQSELERLRFGPPVEDAADLLEQLCKRAETLLKAH